MELSPGNNVKIPQHMLFVGIYCGALYCSNGLSALFKATQPTVGLLFLHLNYNKLQKGVLRYGYGENR